MICSWRWFAVVGWLSLAGCGDDGTAASAGEGGSEEGTASTGTSATGTTATTTSASTTASTSASTTATSDDTGSSGSGSEGSGSVDSSSGSESGTSTSGTGSSGSGEESGSSSGGQGNVEYSALAVPGGLDRIRIFKANFDDDLCTTLSLVWPDGGGGTFQIDTPPQWGVEGANIEVGAAACGGPGPGGGESALSGTGTVAFGMMGQVFPCEIDVDVTLDFAGMMMGIPMSDTMSATGIPVQGC